MRACLALMLAAANLVHATDFRGAQFIPFERFDQFEQTASSTNLILLSPKTRALISWDEMVPSWNFRADGGLELEVKVFYPDFETGWYHLGQWSLNPAELPRQSINGQNDEHGRVATDTLKLRQPATDFQVRITLTPLAASSSTRARAPELLRGLRFLGLALSRSGVTLEPLPPNKAAWGKILTVKERSQANYPEGISEWCSPTATSMLLSFWSTNLHRPDLDHDVPEVARAVHDPSWPGTGNWAFNMAYAGSHPGMRACVARFSDISELEDWIEAGLPAAISVSYGLLKGSSDPGNGHLVVCIGFDSEGNIVVNDPGRSQVRQTYTRENLWRAWNHSNKTVYLVYPEGTALPRDRFGHWE